MNTPHIQRLRESPRQLSHSLLLWLRKAFLVTSLGLVLSTASNAAGTLAEVEFLRLSRHGMERMLRLVEAFPSEGREHVSLGTPVAYRTDPPTSGPHYERWVDPGFYTQAQTPKMLVHSLEHGHVVLYYDKPTETARVYLETWSHLYRGNWDGVVVVPNEGLGKGVVLTAWRHMLPLEKFDPALAAAFVDRYRGRGPEHPVR